MHFVARAGRKPITDRGKRLFGFQRTRAQPFPDRAPEESLDVCGDLILFMVFLLHLELVRSTIARGACSGGRRRAFGLPHGTKFRGPSGASGHTLNPVRRASHLVLRRRRKSPPQDDVVQERFHVAGTQLRGVLPCSVSAGRERQKLPDPKRIRVDGIGGESSLPRNRSELFEQFHEPNIYQTPTR